MRRRLKKPYETTNLPPGTAGSPLVRGLDTGDARKDGKN